MVDDFSSLKDFDIQIKKPPKKKKLIQWFGGRKQKLIQKGSAAKKKGQNIWQHKGAAAKSVARGTIGTTQKMTAAGEKFGYALPAPFQIFTLAWKKISKALKTTLVLVFALVLLFLPIGIFWYAGWAVGASVMFLISLIYWIVISLFNGLAFIIVSAINGVATILMGSIVAMVDAIMGALGLGVWENGRYFLENALIKYSQIANVPSLYAVKEPAWESYMNNTIIGEVLKIFGISLDLSWFAAPFQSFYTGLAPEQAVVLGLVILAIPIVFLGYIYYKNRHLIAG